MNTKMRWSRLAILPVVIAMSLYAQDGPRGHWTGGEQIPGRAPLVVEIDLDRVADGWVGSLSIPAQNATGIPLEAITYANGKCSFRIKGMPGDPTYTGTLSPDGKVFEGNYTEGTTKFPFKFSRTGDPKVEVPEANPKVAQAFVGDWEGTLNLGREGRAVLRISNDDGGARAVLISVDEGNSQVPASSIEQKASVLTIVLKPLGGARYVAEINKEGSELNGTFTVGGMDIPLKLKKAPAPVH